VLRVAFEATATALDQESTAELGVKL